MLFAKDSLAPAGAEIIYDVKSSATSRPDRGTAACRASGRPSFAHQGGMRERGGRSPRDERPRSSSNVYGFDDAHTPGRAC